MNVFDLLHFQFRLRRVFLVLCLTFNVIRTRIKSKPFFFAANNDLFHPLCPRFLPSHFKCNDYFQFQICPSTTNCDSLIQAARVASSDTNSTIQLREPSINIFSCYHINQSNKPATPQPPQWRPPTVPSSASNSSSGSCSSSSSHPSS